MKSLQTSVFILVASGILTVLGTPATTLANTSTDPTMDSTSPDTVTTIDSTTSTEPTTPTTPATEPTTSTTPSTTPTMAPTTPAPSPVVPSNGVNTCAAFNATRDSCSLNGNITINSTSHCTFSCTYDPMKLSPLRLEVHLAYKNPMQNPTFVTAQQRFFMNSWTLPTMFPNGRKNQIYTSVEMLLCPPLKEKTETVEVRITTASEPYVSMNVRLNNQSYSLKMGDKITVKGTPVSPKYRLYQWTGDQMSVVITAESKNKSKSVCAILALQNAKCPVVTDISGLRSGGGQYQTFTDRAGIIASRSAYPDGIHMVFWPLPNNDPCTLVDESQQNQTVRTKSIEFQVFSHSTIGSSWYIFLIAGLCVIALLFGITLVSLKTIERKLNLANIALSTVEEDERELLQENVSFCRASGVGITTITETDGDDNLSESVGEQIQSSTGGLRANRRTQSESSEESLVPTNSGTPRLPYSPHPDALTFTASVNPMYLNWWKKHAVAVSKTAEAQVSEMGFKHNIWIVAVFAALPAIELLRSYLKMLLYHGSEDLCFFNSRCLTGFWIFHDFGSVFTNIISNVAGIAFICIVLKHRTLTTRILQQFTPSNSVGVMRHYGILISLGVGLFLQGWMSSLYHTCPNSVTMRFDMMFMYAMSIAAIVCLWGMRHGDITHHVYPSTGILVTMLVLAEGRAWVSRLAFWLIMSAIYCIMIVSITIMSSFYGIWTFSPLQMNLLRKGWNPVRENLSALPSTGNSTISMPCIVRAVFGIVMNIAIILYGAIADPNVNSYLLSICLINLGLYLGNYIITKRISCKEKGSPLGWVNLFLSFVLWILAVIAFSSHHTNPEASASDSRNMNSPCSFFGVFDTHDAWHLLSSFGFFTLFLGILTLDDDLSKVPSSNIRVF